MRAIVWVVTMGFSEEIICVFSYPVSVRAYWPPGRMTLNVNDLEFVVDTLIVRRPQQI